MIKTDTIQEKLIGIVNRVTYHNTQNGWSVLRVEPFNQRGQQETVTVHQTQVFAGATMEFVGVWQYHEKYGRQFKADKAIERKPASTASLEKYLGSGLIKGVGPKTAKKIIKHFGKSTLDIFDNSVNRLIEVPGISKKKLTIISNAWNEHIKIRDVMLFLQTHGVSTLFAVRIYQTYGDDAIKKVTENPYRLADDFYGIGFFSADKIALSMGIECDSNIRIHAAIKHLLSASREEGHCYLLREQIITGIDKLLQINISSEIDAQLNVLLEDNSLKTREIIHDCHSSTAYYSKSLYYYESEVAEKLNKINHSISVDTTRIELWIKKYCQKNILTLSKQQTDAVIGIVQNNVSILTGGPGCGKTTTILLVAKLLTTMKLRITLVAPTGRAAQRMTEVIEHEAKTIHRLLEWKGGTFQVNQDNPLKTDFVIIDESSMLDISLFHAILNALPAKSQLLLIGDSDQLPSVGAGNVLKDLISSQKVPCFRLTEVFRQAKESLIIHHSHELNKGRIGNLISPFKQPSAWKENIDCLFIDTDEATKEQLAFIKKAKNILNATLKDNLADKEEDTEDDTNLFHFNCNQNNELTNKPEFIIPKKFQHVDLNQLQHSRSNLEELKAVLKTIHPWSSLHYGLTATDVIVKLYSEWLPKYLGSNTEIQILSPMTKGSLGTINLNHLIQNTINPSQAEKSELMIGQRLLREGDRVIHRKNNYNLNVFNGDIGHIISIDTQTICCHVQFQSDQREVIYQKDDLMDLELAYAITIHKSQGSEFSAVIIPVLTQHFKMLYRNLIYTGLTRAKKMAIFVGSRRALSISAKNMDTSKRQTALKELLQ